MKASIHHVFLALCVAVSAIQIAHSNHNANIVVKNSMKEAVTNFTVLYFVYGDFPNGLLDSRNKTWDRIDANTTAPDKLPVEFEVGWFSSNDYWRVSWIIEDGKKLHYVYPYEVLTKKLEGDTTLKRCWLRKEDDKTDLVLHLKTDGHVLEKASGDVELTGSFQLIRY